MYEGWLSEIRGNGVVRPTWFDTEEEAEEVAHFESAHDRSSAFFVFPKETHWEDTLQPRFRAEWHAARERVRAIRER